MVILWRGRTLYKLLFTAASPSSIIFLSIFLGIMNWFFKNMQKPALCCRLCFSFLTHFCQYYLDCKVIPHGTCVTFCISSILGDKSTSVCLLLEYWLWKMRERELERTRWERIYIRISRESSHSQGLVNLCTCVCTHAHIGLDGKPESGSNRCRVLRDIHINEYFCT